MRALCAYFIAEALLSSGSFPQESAQGTSLQPQQDESRQSHACGQNSFLLWMLHTQEQIKDGQRSGEGEKEGVKEGEMEGEKGMWREREREKFMITDTLDRKDHFRRLQARSAFSMHKTLLL